MNLDNQEKIETLESSSVIEQPQDIPTPSFKSINDVQQHQEQLMKQYQEVKTPVVSEEQSPLDLSSTVAQLEAKLKKKKYSMPFSFVVILVVLVNIGWYASIKLIIEPKYEEYVSQSEEIKKNYDVLKSRVDAIVGE